MKNIYQVILNGNNEQKIKEIFDILHDLSKKYHFQYFLLGASARDYWIQNIKEIKTPRKTKDIDIALQLKNKIEFDNITEELTKMGFETTKNKFSFVYKQIPVDFLPFGEIENDKNYDPNKDITSAFGFKEAFDGAEILSKEIKEIKVITLEYFFLVKLLAWNDRPEIRGKDAEDLYFILNNFGKINEEIIYDDEYVDLLKLIGNEYQYNATFLVRKLKKILNTENNETLRNKIIEILDKKKERLATAMKSSDYQNNLLMLDIILKGLK